MSTASGSLNFSMFAVQDIQPFQELVINLGVNMAGH